MTCVGHFETKPPIFKKIIEKNKKCLHTNGMLENGFMYLYGISQFNVINASNIYIYIYEFDSAFITCKIHVIF